MYVSGMTCLLSFELEELVMHERLIRLGIISDAAGYPSSEGDFLKYHCREIELHGKLSGLLVNRSYHEWLLNEIHKTFEAKGGE